MESVAAFAWNGWQASSGISGRLGLEYAEYHNELYGFIESEELLADYKNGKETIEYIRIKRNGDLMSEQKIVSEYIRHQIHHPENTHNARYTDEQLQASINDMRVFIEARAL